MPKKSVKNKKLPQPSEPATLAPIAEHHERKIAEASTTYRPTRGTFDSPRGAASSILRAVEKGGEIQLETLAELMALFRTKTDYHVHIEVATQSPRSALIKTIDNERDAQETIRRLKAKAS